MADDQRNRQDPLDQDRLVTPDAIPASDPVQNSDPALRPRRLAEFVGQGQGRTNLETFIGAARLREEPMDHTLLHGPPGLGKTTICLLYTSDAADES